MFRREALEGRKVKWKGRAVLLKGFPSWIVFAMSSLLFFVFLMFLAFGVYTRRVNVSGEVTSYPGLISLYSDVRGVVIDKYVKEGQEVKKGDLLYLIDVSRSTLNGVVSSNQKRDIKEQMEQILNIIKSLKLSKENTISMLKKQHSRYVSSLKHSTDVLMSANTGVGIMKKNMNDYRHYKDHGLINNDQLATQTSIYYQQLGNLLSLSSQNEQNALQATALESQIQTQSADFDNRIYEMELKKLDLQKEMNTAEVEGKVVIRALSDGKVDSLSVSVGQMVNAGDSLIQLLPGTVKRYDLVLWVTNDAVPYVHSGGNVNLRYEAFPPEKFGQFSAIVKLVSKAPASPQEMMMYQGAPRNNQGGSTPYYKVIVTPKKQIIKHDGKLMPLENGMKAQATLFLETRKIYQWMFSPFYDMKHSASGPVNENE